MADVSKRPQIVIAQPLHLLRDYYLPKKGLVVIQDVSPFVPELVAAAVEAAEADEE